MPPPEHAPPRIEKRRPDRNPAFREAQSSLFQSDAEEGGVVQASYFAPPPTAAADGFSKESA